MKVLLIIGGLALLYWRNTVSGGQWAVGSQPASAADGDGSFAPVSNPFSVAGQSASVAHGSAVNPRASSLVPEFVGSAAQYSLPLIRTADGHLVTNPDAQYFYLTVPGSRQKARL